MKDSEFIVMILVFVVFMLLGRNIGYKVKIIKEKHELELLKAIKWLMDTASKFCAVVAAIAFMSLIIVQKMSTLHIIVFIAMAGVVGWLAGSLIFVRRTLNEKAYQEKEK